MHPGSPLLLQRRGNNNWHLMHPGSTLLLQRRGNSNWLMMHPGYHLLLQRRGNSNWHMMHPGSPLLLQRRGNSNWHLMHPGSTLLLQRRGNSNWHLMHPGSTLLLQRRGNSNWVNSLRTDGDFCPQGRDTAIAKKFKIVEIYWLTWPLESSRGALSDGTISFFGKDAFSEFLSKTSVIQIGPNEPGKYSCCWGTITRIWVSVVCSIMNSFMFTFNKNLNFAPQDTWSWLV
jgi:hypothetical protein